MVQIMYLPPVWQDEESLPCPPQISDSWRRRWGCARRRGRTGALTSSCSV